MALQLIVKLKKTKDKGKTVKTVLAGVAQLVGVLSCKPKGHGFDSQSGKMPREWVIDGCFSLTLVFLSLSLFLSSPSLKSISMSSGEGKKYICIYKSNQNKTEK